MKRTTETSDQFWKRTRREIAECEVPAGFTWAWWKNNKSNKQWGWGKMEDVVWTIPPLPSRGNEND